VQQPIRRTWIRAPRRIVAFILIAKNQRYQRIQCSELVVLSFVDDRRRECFACVRQRR
jgi:hypothetical protein